MVQIKYLGDCFSQLRIKLERSFMLVITVESAKYLTLLLHSAWWLTDGCCFMRPICSL